MSCFWSNFTQIFKEQKEVRKNIPQSSKSWYFVGRRSVSDSMKLGPLGSWEMYSSELYFGHPLVTWQLWTDANVEVLLIRNQKKGKRYHMAVRVWYTVSDFVHMLLLNIHTCPPESCCFGRLSLPSFSSCYLCSFLLVWKIGEFSVLCQGFVENISVLH